MVSSPVISLSYAARRELIERVAPLYHEASFAQKGLLLDRMVTMTGYARKYAIHLLNHAPESREDTRDVPFLHQSQRARKWECEASS